MNRNIIKILSLFLLAGMALVLLSTQAQAQGGPGTSPLLVVKVPNVEQLIGNIQKLAPESPEITKQIEGLRMMLQGTDWIDTGRSIVIEMSLTSPQNPAVALIPFLTPNNNFSNAYSPVTGDNYYLIPIPPPAAPNPNFTVSPEMEQRLVDASLTPAAGSIVVEAAISRLIAMVEPLISASLAKIDPSRIEEQTEGTTPSPLSQEEINTIVTELFAIMKQAEIFRLGMDATDDAFLFLLDIEAAPGSELANAFVDVGGTSRLTNYSVDMPIKIHTRAYNIAESQKIMRSYIGTVYGMLGADIDYDEMIRLTESITGEQAGGLDFNSDGLVVRLASVLSPGIDGESFLRDEYLPFLERYGNSITDMANEQEGGPATISFERTEDSIVDGTNVMGIKINIPVTRETKEIPFDNLSMRLAAKNGLLLIANDDAGIEELIAGTRNLTPVPASGPTGRIEMDLSRLLDNIKSLTPPDQTGPEFPEDLGTIAVDFDMKDGKLTTRTSVDLDFFSKITKAIQENAARKTDESEHQDQTGEGTL